METTGLVVDTHFGTWHTIDSQNFGGKDYFLMEHDKFGDEAACVIVDSSGKLVAEDIWNGFDKDTVEMQTATFCGQQGRISRPVKAILSGRL